MTILQNRAVQKLFEPQHIATLVCFRMVFGLVMLWEVFRYFEDGKIYRYWIEPEFHFKYFGFEWVKPWPGELMYVHFFALGFLAASIAIGFKYRITSILFFIGFSYVFLLDATHYLNHFYLIALVSFIMIFMPAHKAFSFDSWHNKKIQQYFVPGWTVWALRAQIGVPYFFGGIAKIDQDWLAGNPLRFWLEESSDRIPLIGEFFMEAWIAYFFAWSSLLIDLLAVPLLLWRRSRVFTYGVLVLFHLLNSQLFNIGIFPWFMIGATLIFFDSDWPHIFKKIKECKRPKISTLQTKYQKEVLILFLIFIIYNSAMPLRHHAYSGYVSWTEEGHNFSWHMKLRDKDSSILFIVTDPKTDETWIVDPHKDLTERQVLKMANRPDMILQYSHFLAHKYEKDGRPDIEIRADVFAALNGRTAQRLIDPTINLAAEPISILPKTWILPLDEEY